MTILIVRLETISSTSSSNGLNSVHPIANQSHHTNTLHFHLDMLGQFLVDPLSLRSVQPLQNSNFKFKQCLKPTDEGVILEIKGTLFAIFKIIRQKESTLTGFCLSPNREALIYLFLTDYRLGERKTSDDHYRKIEKIGEIIDHINKHYVETLTIEQLSELMGYSIDAFL